MRIAGPAVSVCRWSHTADVDQYEAKKRGHAVRHLTEVGIAQQRIFRSGIVETDWSPYTFTMNWLFTRPGHEVRFEVGEPFCHLFPVRRGELEALSPTIRKLSEQPELEREHKLWSQSRNTFNAELSVPGSQAVKEQWQKTYFRGVTPSGRPGPDSHRSRIRLRPFKAVE